MPIGDQDHAVACWRARATRVACALAALLVAGAAEAGSYMQSGGDLSLSSSLGYLWATQQWDTNGRLQDSGCRREYSYLSNHLEYGYSYYHTLYGGVNLARSSCDPDSNSGLGDIRAGVRGRLDVNRNNRTWELEATIPTDSGNDPNGLNLGCNSLGLAGNVAMKEKLLSQLAFGAGAGVQLWEGPLVHQLVGDLSLGGSFTRWSPWTWELGLSGKRPLNSGDTPASGALSDCGTRSKVVRSAARIGYQYTDFVNLECGASLALWGVDVGRTQGFYCGFSRLWK